MASINRERILSLDLYRGFIIILMALDHTVYFVVNTHPMEFFGAGFGDYIFPEYKTYIHLFTRVATHICAPSFFFLLGVSMVLYKRAKSDKGLTKQEVTLHFVKRGFMLIVLQLTLVNGAWFLGTINNDLIESSFPSGGFGDVWISPDVMSTLGIAMILFALLMHLSNKYMMLMSGLMLMLTQVFYPTGDMLTKLLHPLHRLLMVPGQTNSLLVNYPILPWLPLVGFGVVFGRLLLANRHKTYKEFGMVGCALLVLFGLLRLLKLGDYHESWSYITEIFSLTKYPPSIHYLLFGLGISFVIMWIIDVIEDKYVEIIRNRSDFGTVRKVLLTFGQSSLFFYIIHLYIYAFIGLFFSHIDSYVLIYTLWIVGLVPSYYLCCVYDRFHLKRKQRIT